MKHRRLFDIRVRHQYFAGRACPDLVVAPSTRGLSVLQRQRLLARTSPDGLEVIAGVDELGDPAIPFLNDLRIEFAVHVTDDDFYHYTDTGAWDAVAAPVYRDARAEGGALILAAGDRVASPGPAARIEISGVTAAWLAAPPRFTLELKSPAAAWVFYLLTARPNGALPELRIDDAQAGLAFERVLLAPGAVAEADDPVGHHLLVQHPGRRCVRFASTAPITSRSAATRGLALHLGGELLLHELGSPDLRSRAALKLMPDQPAQPSLYRVIEY